MSIKVKLTPNEMMMAATIGICRHIACLKTGAVPAHGMDPEDAWRAHIEGACGECATAKALKLFWPATVNTFRDGGDLGPLQIRTRSKANYDLLIRETDEKDDETFVLVIGVCPYYEVIGHIRCGDAKRDEFLQTYGGRPAAWFVPRGKLIQFDED